jgi:hypothetical protein
MIWECSGRVRVSLQEFTHGQVECVGVPFNVSLNLEQLCESRDLRTLIWMVGG